MTFIKVEELLRVYRMEDIEIRAIRGLSLEVNEGELVSIMGSSGAGKTTLLNILGGLDQPTSGQIWVDEVEITGLSWEKLIPYRRRVVGHIFQSLNLLPTLSTAENIALPMILDGVSKNERRNRVNELLEIVQLTHRSTHRPSELSGGEQQRVAIAAALANDPPIILADEPTGELDSETSKVIMDFLVHINQEYKKTIILVTHNPLVSAVTQRILRIEDGRITGSYLPSDLGSAIPISFIDRLRERIKQFDELLASLDERFKSQELSGDEYTMERIKIIAAKQAFLDEMHRYGTG
jgi:putative ABC transport system ATP-binding protein